jgi:hypothetical protein
MQPVNATVRGAVRDDPRTRAGAGACTLVVVIAFVSKSPPDWKSRFSRVQARAELIEQSYLNDGSTPVIFASGPTTTCIFIGGDPRKNISMDDKCREARLELGLWMKIVIAKS